MLIVTELPSLKSNDERAIREFVTKIGQTFPSQVGLIELYGSKALGDYREDSDTDILIILDPKDLKVIDEIYSILLDIELEFGANISLRILSAQEFDYLHTLRTPFMANLQREGIVLWKR